MGIWQSGAGGSGTAAAVDVRTLTSLGSTGTLNLSSLGSVLAQYTLSANAVLSFSNVVAGSVVTLLVQQPIGSGPFTLSLSDGTNTFPVSDLDLTPGNETWISVVFTAPTVFYAVVIGSFVAPIAPVNTVAPAVTGNAWTGQVLTCSTGTWTGSPTPSYTYQWTRDGSNIVGETASTYTVVSGDVTHAVVCVVTATNEAGSATHNSNSVTPTTAPTVPAQVTGLTATPGTNSMALSWTEPSNGGATITDASVQYKLHSSGTWLDFSHSALGTGNSTNVTGLTGGSSYDFQVACINGVGTGTYSTTATATPSAPSGAALVAHTTGVFSTGNSGVTTSAINTTGATCLFVAVAGYASQTGADFDDQLTDSKGNSWTLLSNSGVGQAHGVASGIGLAVLYCSNPSVGTGHTFTQSPPASGNAYCAVAVAAFSGTTLSGTPDVNIGAASASNSSIQPGSATPAHNNELVLTAFAQLDAATVAVDSGFTITDQVGHGSNNQGVGLAYLVQTTAAAVNPAWTGTFTSSALLAQMVSFQ